MLRGERANNWPVPCSVEALAPPAPGLLSLTSRLLTPTSSRACRACVPAGPKAHPLIVSPQSPSPVGQRRRAGAFEKSDPTATCSGRHALISSTWGRLLCANRRALIRGRGEACSDTKRRETVHPWPTFVLIVLVLGFIVAIAEIIVTEMRAKPADARLVALEQPDLDSAGAVDLEALHRFEQ